ncbi:hypothetical protein OC834_007780, partial [Tilletia horrida]
GRHTTGRNGTTASNTKFLSLLTACCGLTDQSSAADMTVLSSARAGCTSGSMNTQKTDMGSCTSLPTRATLGTTS